MPNYANKEHTIISHEGLVIPCVVGNSDYDEIIASGTEIKPYVEPEKTYVEKRTASLSEGGYGTFAEQLEIIGEQGMEAYQAHIQSVKTNIPKL